MQELKNPKHEAFCRAYVSKERQTRFNATRTYMLIYPRAAYKTASVNGSRLLGKTRIRIISLIEPYLEDRQLRGMVDVFKRSLDSKNPRIQMEAVKMGLRLYGLI